MLWEYEPQASVPAGFPGSPKLSRVLSNDPDKNYSIFYCSAAIRFETVVFSDQEFINRWKAGL